MAGGRGMSSERAAAADARVDDRSRVAANPAVSGSRATAEADRVRPVSDADIIERDTGGGERERPL